MNKFENSCAENPCPSDSSSVQRKRITLVKNEAVPPKALKEALAHVRKGGKLLVTTSFRVVTIDHRMLREYEKCKNWLLIEQGNGYRIRSGRGSVYLMPGQLRVIG